MIEHILMTTLFVCIPLNLIFFTDQSQLEGTIVQEILFDEHFYLTGTNQSKDFVLLCETKYYEKGCNSKNRREVKHSQLEKQKCFNIEEHVPGRKITFIRENGKCVRVYDGYGCSGTSLTILTNDNCGINLHRCGWKPGSRVKAISLCEDIPPEITIPYGSRGRKCETKCLSTEHDGTPYFRCGIQDSWDYCSPRLGQNFFGEFCLDKCALPDLWLSNNTVVYEHEKFQGKGKEIKLNENTTCKNIDLTSAKDSMLSLSIPQLCIRLYTRAGCTGSWKQLNSNSFFSVPQDHARSISLCNFSAGGKITGPLHKSNDRVDTSKNHHVNNEGSNNPGSQNSDETEDDDKSGWKDCESGDNYGDEDVGDDKEYETESWWESFIDVDEYKDKESNNIESNNESGWEKYESVLVKYESGDVYENENINDMQYNDENERGEYESGEQDENENGDFSFFPTSRGKSCQTNCMAKGRLYYWCEIDSQGSWDFCFPKSGQYLIEDFDTDNYSLADSWRIDKPFILKSTKFQTITTNQTRSYYDKCTNVPSGTKTSISISMSNKPRCVRLFRSIGCVGAWEDFDTELLLYIVPNKVKSLSICNATFPEVRATPINGGKCVKDCKAGIMPYFSCKLAKGTRTFCSPRDFTDYLGNSCNVTQCKTNQTKHPWLPVLYELSGFEGKEYFLNRGEQACYNIYNEQPEVKWNSIDVKDTCIRLYYEIGCLGRYLVVTKSSNNKCARDISGCGDFTSLFLVRSVSYCNTSDPLRHNVALGGKPCEAGCYASDHVFTCRVKLGYVDMCSPAVGVDYVGNHCEVNCVNNSKERTFQVTLYEKPHFKGVAKIVTHTTGQICYNVLENSPLTNFSYSSIDLHDNCVILYRGIGCTGPSTEFFSRTFSRCLHNIKTCKRMPGEWFSLSFCGDPIPSMRSKFCGISGKFCIDDCTSKDNLVFTCKTDANITEYCYPRKGLDYSGQYVCNDCDCQDHDDFIIVSLDNYQIDGYLDIIENEQMNVSLGETKHCFNLHQNSRKTQKRVGHVTYLKLIDASCIQLHEYIGCTGFNVKIYDDYEAEDWKDNLCKECVGHRPQSISLCNQSFPESYSKPVGLSGSKCINSCANNFRDTFTCDTQVRKHEFCIPREDLQNYYTGPGTNETQPSHNKVNVKYKQCYNVEQSNDSIKNLLLKSLAANVCLHIYEGFACTGGFTKSLKINGPNKNNVDLHRIASFKTCDAYLTPKYHVTLGSSGHACETPCVFSEDATSYCKIKYGFLDVCLPRPKEMQFEKFQIGDSLEDWSFKDYEKTVTLFEESYFSNPVNSPRVLYSHLKKNICLNIAELASKIAISSVKLNSHCVTAYDDFGCTGNYTVLLPNNTCTISLDACGWDDKIVSIGICEESLAIQLFEVKGSRGQSCRTNCTSLGKPYFWCDIDDNGSWDYCSPRLRQTFFGKLCKDNCPLPDLWLTENIVVYESAHYQGRGTEIVLNNNITCQNILPTRSINLPFSISVKQHCVVVYTRIACTGERTVFEAEELFEVRTEQIKSISLCKSTFRQEVGVSMSGKNCTSDCVTGLLPYFSCVQANGLLQFCSPRNSINYLGHSCNGSDCVTVEAANHPWLPVLYTLSFYNGESRILGRDKCINLVHESPGLTWNSIDIKDFCLVFYKGVGCTGRQHIVQASSEISCLQDFRSCSWKFPFSVSHCNKTSIKFHHLPKSIAGKPCLSKCTTSSLLSAFTCLVDKSGFDFCSPAKDLNFLGEYCGRNCTRRKRQNFEIFQKPNFEGRAITIRHSATKICHNLPETFFAPTNFQIASANLYGSCVVFYESFGCVKSSTGPVPPHCSRNLMNCNLSGNWKSVKFCKDGIPRVTNQPCGLSGKLCKDACLPHGNTSFSCSTESGTTEYCFPRNGVNFTGQELCRDCRCKTIDDLATVEYESVKSVGKKSYQIPLAEAQLCFNFEYDRRNNESLNEKELRFIITADVNRIKLYQNIGCSGKSNIVSGTFDMKCVNESEKQDFWAPEEHLDEDGCAKSLSLCNSTFAKMYDEPAGLSGSKCINACKLTLSPNYYTCNTSFSENEFCIPREDLNHFGQICKDDNCVFRKQIAFSIPSKTFDKKLSIELNDASACYNVNHRNNEGTNSTINYISSINENISCLVLYSDVNCTGYKIRTTVDVAMNCLQNPTICDVGNISSFAFCDAYLPQRFQLPVGNSGNICKSLCTTRPSKKQQYFSCELHDGSLDFCSSRPEQIYVFGRNLQG